MAHAKNPTRTEVRAASGEKEDRPADMGSNQTQAGLLGECGSLPHGFPRIPRIAKERTAYGRTNASLTRLRGSAQRPAEGKGLDRGFSLRQNLTPNRTARLVISGGSIVTPGATSIMVNPKRKNDPHV